VAGAIVLGALVIAGTIALTRSSDEGSTNSAASQAPSPTVSSATTQKVSGKFHVYPNDWFDTIEGTEWNRCDGEPECDGLECYGKGAADGLGFGTELVVTNADGKKVGLDEISNSWGWKRGATRGGCEFIWSVEVPETESGVLTVTFDDNPDWAVDFTLAKMKKLPHALDLIGIGDVDE
jgi:hypothetical protein